LAVILGIDPGLAATGYGVIRVEGSHLRHVAHGAFTTTPEQDRGVRLLAIRDALTAVLARYRPDQACVESLFFSRNVRSALPVAEARGVILMCLADAGVAVGEHTPLRVKQAVLGHGRADKQQMSAMVRVLFQIDPDEPLPHHAADALAVAVCHAHSSPLDSRTPH
jgi:crossover junction endodeoxyribonuclease RuvC